MNTNTLKVSTLKKAILNIAKHTLASFNLATQIKEDMDTLYNKHNKDKDNTSSTTKLDNYVMGYDPIKKEDSNTTTEPVNNDTFSTSLGFLGGSQARPSSYSARINRGYLKREIDEYINVKERLKYNEYNNKKGMMEQIEGIGYKYMGYATEEIGEALYMLQSQSGIAKLINDTRFRFKEILDVLPNIDNYKIINYDIKLIYK